MYKLKIITAMLLFTFALGCNKMKDVTPTQDAGVQQDDAAFKELKAKIAQIENQNYSGSNKYGGVTYPELFSAINPLDTLGVRHNEVSLFLLSKRDTILNSNISVMFTLLCDDAKVCVSRSDTLGKILGYYMEYKSKILGTNWLVSLEQAVTNFQNNINQIVPLNVQDILQQAVNSSVITSLQKDILLLYYEKSKLPIRPFINVSKELEIFVVNHTGLTSLQKTHILESIAVGKFSKWFWVVDVKPDFGETGPSGPLSGIDALLIHWGACYSVGYIGSSQACGDAWSICWWMMGLPT